MRVFVLSVTEENVDRTAGTRKKLFITIGIMLGVAGGYFFFPDVYRSMWSLVTQFINEPERLQERITRMGAGGYLFIILIQVVQIVIFPLPGQLSVIIAGVFGTSWGWIAGMALALAGLTIGAVLAFLVGRYFFRDWVSRKLSDNKSWQTFSELSGGKGLWVIGLIYVFPGLPNDFMCYVLGLSRAPFAKFVLVSTVCRIPNVAATFLIGYYAGYSNWRLVGIIGGAVFIATLFIYLRRERIEEWVRVKVKGEG